MYFLADIIKEMYDKNYISREDLYNFSEKEIVDLIKSCKDNKISSDFEKFMNCNDFIDCEEYHYDKFCVDRKVKRRYINPIVRNVRVYDISKKSKEKIDNYLNMKISKFSYIDM